MMIKQPFSLMFIAIVIVLSVLPGCGRIQQGQTQAGDETIIMDLQTEPRPATVGPATLILSLADQEGRPINQASVEVEGNMSHAGMVPVFAQATAGEDGRYTLPFEWTMGGDWILTVTVELPDGRSVTRRFDVLVESG